MASGILNQVQIFCHISHFLGNRWYSSSGWDASCKNTKLMLELLKGQFLGLIFSYNVLMTLLMMLSVTLLSMLMMLLSTLSAIRYQICANNKRWLLNSKLNCETLKTVVRRGLLILILTSLSLFRFTSNITLSLWMWKWIVCWRKLIFKYAGVPFLL